jgi:hypothetical protein
VWSASTIALPQLNHKKKATRVCLAIKRLLALQAAQLGCSGITCRHAVTTVPAKLLLIQAKPQSNYDTAAVQGGPMMA